MIENYLRHEKWIFNQNSLQDNWNQASGLLVWNAIRSKSEGSVGGGNSCLIAVMDHHQEIRD